MKVRITIIGLVLLAQVGCVNENLDVVFTDDPSIETLSGKWKVISFEDFNTGKVQRKTQENSWGKDIIVTFDETTLSGTNTTNSVFGEFVYVGQRRFSVSNFSTTEVAQPEWADNFTEAILDGEVPFRINESRLRVYYANESKSMTLARQ